MARWSGIRVRIKKGWMDEGKVGTCLGRPVLIGQCWLPVLWDDEEDPDFFKVRGLERTTGKNLPAS